MDKNTTTKTTDEISAKLKAPFRLDELEYRVASCDNSDNPKWVRYFTYVTARAIMERFDSILGIDGWQCGYTDHHGGTICRILVFFPGVGWIAKEDGAEDTDIEPIKGGISSALKRAAVLWGIGRYLYALDDGFGTIVPQNTKGALWGKNKGGKEFYWIPKPMPEWALHDLDKKSSTDKKSPHDKKSTSNNLSEINTSWDEKKYLEYIQTRYGVKKTTDLTKQQVDDVGKLIRTFSFEEAMSELTNFDQRA
jgi:hypothetical protein